METDNLFDISRRKKIWDNLEFSINFNTFVKYISMKYNELSRLLSSKGCRTVRQGGNHEIWYSPLTDKVFPMPRNQSQEVSKNTLNNILKQSGIES